MPVHSQDCDGDFHLTVKIVTSSMFLFHVQSLRKLCFPCCHKHFFSKVFMLIILPADLLNCLQCWWQWLHRIQSCVQLTIMEFVMNDLWKKTAEKCLDANYISEVMNLNQGNQKPPQYLESWFFIFFCSSLSSHWQHKSHLVEFKAKDNIE